LSQSKSQDKIDKLEFQRLNDRVRALETDKEALKERCVQMERELDKKQRYGGKARSDSDAAERCSQLERQIIVLRTELQVRLFAYVHVHQLYSSNGKETKRR
jgi:hypothetical protein